MAQDPRPRRVTLTGPECTGKTELAQRVSRELGIEWTPEYAREYAESRGLLTADDVEPIARGEIANLERASGSLILQDTDLLSTVVYARYYYGGCPRWIEEEAWTRRADFYLLFDTDVPWLSDVVRDDSDAREDLFDAFRAALDEFETEWEIVSGGWEERARVCINRLRAIVPREPIPSDTDGA